MGRMVSVSYALTHCLLIDGLIIRYMFNRMVLLLWMEELTLT